MPKVFVHGKLVDYKPYMDDMYMDNLMVKLEKNPSFKRVLKRNLTDKFFNSLKAIIDPNVLHEQNMILSVFGKTGTGKSIVMISLCKYLDSQKFSYQNIAFFDSEILTMAENIPKNSFIIRDEGVDKAVYGVGSVRQSSQLHVLGETARKHGLSLIFIEPEFRENELAKYYIETVDMDVHNRITRCALLEPYTREYMGAVYIPVLSEDDPDWIKYNERKDYFITKMRKGELSGAKADYRAIAVDLASKIDTDVFQKKGDRVAYVQAKYPNYTNNEIKVICTFLEAVLEHGKHAIYDDEEFGEVEDNQ